MRIAKVGRCGEVTVRCEMCGVRERCDREVLMVWVVQLVAYGGGGRERCG